MKRSNHFMDKVGQFITGNGFYLVVLVCVAAIGISGYYLVRAVMDGTESQPVSTVEEVTAGVSGEREESDPVVVETRPVVWEEPVDEASATADIPVVSQEPAVDVLESAAPVEEPPAEELFEETEPAPQVNGKPIPLVFTWPVNGPVIAPFSVETLLYDETMLDWRVHEGIDIAVEEGIRVLAAAAGTVSEVYEDELMGVTVVIDHGDDLVSVYANLTANPSVEVGQRVYTGDIIGAVGSTAAAEIGRASHLHYAMYQGGTPVNPEEYLPE